jgi:hypothetical protein
MEETLITNPTGYDDPETAAVTVMKLLPVFVTPEMAELLGFDDDAIENSTLSLGKPLPVFYISHESLQKHKKRTNVRKLLVSGEELIYPIIREGKEISSVTVKMKQSGKWFFKSLGNASLTKGLTEVRNRLLQTSDKDESEYFVVHIPTMSKILIGHYDGKGYLKLTHVHDNVEYGFAKHATNTGKYVIETILPKARLTRFAPPDDMSRIKVKS